MHILFLNYAYDVNLRTPFELLRQYRAIPEWCSAVRKAGAKKVTVVQRYSQSTRLKIDGVDFSFINDGLRPILKWWQNPVEIHDLVAELSPDVVHINGTVFFARSLRSVLKRNIPILWQSHSNGNPSWRSQWLWKKSLRWVDSVFVTSINQVEPWRVLGLINGSHQIYEIPVASTSLRPVSYQKSRSSIGMQGQNVFLWVGRLNANKDPITVLRGFSEIARADDRAHLYMIYNTTDLLNDVENAITRFSLKRRVHLLGFIEHEKLPQYFSAADYFLLGSHQEVCGFALIEAIACGATPIVTDIPSFRKITADASIGFLWQPGNPKSLADALKRALEHNKSRTRIKSFFRKHLSYDVLGPLALDYYRQAMEKRSAMTGEIPDRSNFK